MNNIVFGQYIYKDSAVHKMDPRSKLAILFILMIGVFLIPMNNFILLLISSLIPIIAIIFSKISLFKYLKSLKQIAFIMIFSFVIQLLTSKTGTILYTFPINLTYVNILIGVFVLILFFIVRKYLPFKLIIFMILLVGIIYILRYPIYGSVLKNINWDIYDTGLINGSFLVARVFVIIIASTTLTLTTKPTDLTNAIEWYLKPLEALKIKTSIFAMMISIALRFIPTLFNETNKILKAQASRGVDFNEGKFTEQVKQIVSLLIPMFVISIKRAEDLADAMEARGYIPGEKRTKLVEMKFKFVDYLSMFIVIILFILLILGKCGLYAL